MRLFVYKIGPNRVLPAGSESTKFLTRRFWFYVEFAYIIFLSLRLRNRELLAKFQKNRFSKSQKSTFLGTFKYF